MADRLWKNRVNLKIEVGQGLEHMSRKEDMQP